MVDTATSEQPYVIFNNGNKFPQIGLGTFLSSEGDTVKVVFEAIVNNGYRHIDTASIYQNEDAIGEALQEAFKAGIKREDVLSPPSSGRTSAMMSRVLSAGV